MLKVTVSSPAMRELKGVGKTSGKDYHMAIQNVWVHTYEKDGSPLPFPEKIELMLDKTPDGRFVPFEPGEYVLHPSSLYVDSTGKLAVAPKLHQPAKRG
jgi:Helix-destabilising protein